MTIRRTGLAVLSTLAIVCVLITAAQAAPQASFLSPQVTPNKPNITAFVYIPLVSNPPPPGASGEWTQQAHDAQHTGYTSQVVSTPWHWKWAWNGPNAQGAVAANKISLPRNVQPITGGGRVYIAAGANGVFALDTATGSQVWNRNPGGSINSTPAYDPASDSLYVVSSNGQLYRLNAATGQTTGNFDGQSTSTLPLPPALYGSRVYFSMGTHVFAIQKSSMTQLWAYDAGSPVDAPPAFSPSTGLVVADSNDLYIHAIHDTNGARAWRVKPTPLAPGDPADSNPDAQVSYGWPVIAEVHGLVLVKLRLNWQTLWTWNPWPSTNAEMRSNLVNQPGQQSLYALRLSDGGVAFVSNVGDGGFGDGGYLAMGPQPVVKKFANGTEVAYVVMRGSACINQPCDGRYDSHFGEMELDASTISGFQAGEVRFMQNTFFPTDEQPSLSMSGDDIFGGHWMFGIALQILDRSPYRGVSSSAPITTGNLPHIITSASNCAFSSSHYCANGLVQDGDPRNIPAGFYIYFNQGQVYNQYWRGSSAWVVSGNLVFYLSNDGALVVLESGATVQTPTLVQASLQQKTLPPVVDQPISFSQARSYVGSVAAVDGVIKYIFNNGKYVLLGFQYPHQTFFKALIPKNAWNSFGASPEKQFALGQSVRVHGLIEWYQGDPVIYGRQPDQIHILSDK
ncbi:MAG TPA: PQQ-binding-like beta-propeller repeat protein [Anaerolineaceae bacterium]|nr:PQQ-binding-like beta-propeller repeat protein [Anaerolineaceae bacterium]